MSANGYRRWLKDYLAENGISIRSAAKAAGISHVALLDAFSYEGRKGISTLMKVAKGLGIRVTTQYVVTRVPRKDKPRRSIYGFGGKG